MRSLFITVLILLLGGQVLQAQGFGRNKPRYNELDFQVLETPHFKIHHYLQNDTTLTEFANWTEQWYQLHQSVLLDTFDKKNPLILYDNHADFQQTGAVGGLIGVGTGGVTEGLRNRVVLPFAMSDQQTHHVLGHELVHAFQYHKILGSSDTTLGYQNLQNLPLWMVEGMAEYLSIGRYDSHTAMWMRDAVLHDNIPSIKDLSKPEYFPYRYGQAFWAFIGGTFGDDKIEPLFIATAKYGLEPALDSVLHIGQENLSDLWKNALKNYYEPLMDLDKEARFGIEILDDENAGELNVTPVLSPDGRYLIFLSEKNVFTTDLYLADARTGEIMRKVASTVKDGHLDNLDFLESAGTWSPDSKLFAFVAFQKGRNVLVIKDVSNGKTIKELEIAGVPAFSNPAWSPVDDRIVVSGLVDGRSDLYLVN
ncbi:MAG: PD40 domain-containing protein, partial [Phaeodactylibacter sp.]|nr:PD40 domain-containing protein [Phaeodactylibacter sp.]